MKLSSSTGDFSHYVDSVPEKVACFKETKFKYINLEQTGTCPALFSDNDDDWKRFANECGEAAAKAGVKLVVSHAPCLHNPIFAALKNPNNEEYRRNIRALRRSVEVCNMLGIERIVIHACASLENSFTKELFYKYNTMFYQEFFDLMEKYDITVMTENWDNSQSYFTTGKDMREFLDFINHPLLCACWDTAHANIDSIAREMGQYKNIIDLGNKLKGLHIADNFGDCHHHSWPFAGLVNFDEVMHGLIDVNYDGYFNFEASYTLLHHNNAPYPRKPFEHQGKTITTLLDPSIELKKKAVDLLYDVGQYILEKYNCFEAK